MDRDRENLWIRRSNSVKPSLSMSGLDSHDNKSDHPTRTYSSSKRYGGGDALSHGRSNPFNPISPLATTNISSPTSSASSAFGLGSGAFASFGSATKTPKTPGPAFDFSKAAGATASPSTAAERKEKGLSRPSMSRSTTQPTGGDIAASSAPNTDPGAPWPLKYNWVMWYRPPTSKHSDYEKSTQSMCRMASVQEFWKVYCHLIRPSTLPTVSDYHFFKEGIRPVWEDEENKRGGKWIMRLKKGVADRYWEDLLLALIGDQFAEAGEEICGAVISVRSGEDVFSIWTKKDGGKNVRIRETLKRILNLPPDTSIVWKSHDDSIAQRTLVEQARQEKAGHHTPDKRRGTSTTTAHESTLPKDKSNAS